MVETKKKILIFIVAYNATSTLWRVLDRIPEKVFQHDCHILVIDDHSADDTFETAVRYRDSHPGRNVVVLFNPENQGYGGNQKIGYQYAIEKGFDVVALLHGDGQYAPEMLEELIAPVLMGEVDAVLGTRMAQPSRALGGGMPLYKFVGNRVLTSVQNWLLGSRLSEFHCGYRVYSVAALSRLPVHFNTNDFHFDTEIIIELMIHRFRIREIPIPTYYGDEICYVNGLSYAWNVVKATVGWKLHQMGLFYRRQYDLAEGVTQYDLKLGYPSSHTMALAEVRDGWKVLDVGCGEGALWEEMEKRSCRVSGVDRTPAGFAARSGRFVAADLDREALPFSPDAFDCILLLDIVEHVDDPYRLLDDIRARYGQTRPVVLISVPNVGFLPVRLQLLLGSFNYGRRGILDYTHKRLFTRASIHQMLEQSGYKIETMKGVPAPYPLAIGTNLVSAALLQINALLICLFPGLFSYQIFIRAVPLPTVRALLRATEARSEERATSGPPLRESVRPAAAPGDPSGCRSPATPTSARDVCSRGKGMRASVALRATVLVLLSAVAFWSVWNDASSSYTWLFFTVLAAVIAAFFKVRPRGDQPPEGIARYKESALCLLAIVVGGHSLLFYGLPLVALVSVFLGLVLLTVMIGGAQGLLVSASLLTVTLMLNVTVAVTGVATSMYYRPHEMLASYDERFGPVYQRHAHVTMPMRHGDIQAMENLGLYEPREVEFKTDGLGFRNEQDYHGQRYVLIGDSFLAGNGTTQACLVSDRLRRNYGLDVYNLGFTGDLAAYQRRLEAFRSLHGSTFRAVMFVSESNDFVGWENPEALSKSAAFGYRAFFRSNSLWRYTRWLYNRWSRKDTAKSPVFMVGPAPIAFYLGHVNAVMNEKDLEDSALRFSQVLKEMKDIVAHIFFIPDKYRVYYPFLGPANGPVILPNKQWEYLSWAAAQSRIPVTDLTRPLREEAGRLLPEGRHVFWRDDTHWNCEGMAVAAREVARILGPR
jgi:glycosyltransferase involved in cell wall biosynthesis